MITISELKVARTRIMRALTTCERNIERLTRSDDNGCSLRRGTCIIIDKSRMMTITTKIHMTTYEFAPLYPTLFTADAATRIIQHDVFIDGCGFNVTLEIVGELEYYRLLKDFISRRLGACDEAIKLMQQQ